MDISIEVTDPRDVFTTIHFKDIDPHCKGILSRNFCNLMLRRQNEEEPEVEMIGEITGLDFTPLYDMEKYWDELNAEAQLSFAKTEEERESIQKRINEDKASLKGNLNVVLELINSMIEKLSSIGNLAEILKSRGSD